MKDVNFVLREKEMDIARVRKEIEALHLAIPLLAENRDSGETGIAQPESLLTVSRDWGYSPALRTTTCVDETRPFELGCQRDGSGTD